MSHTKAEQGIGESWNKGDFQGSNYYEKDGGMSWLGAYASEGKASDILHI